MFPANNAVKQKKRVEYLDKAAPLNLPKGETCSKQECYNNQTFFSNRYKIIVFLQNVTIKIMHATYNAGKLQYAVNQFLPFGEVRRGCYYDALANVTEAAYDYRVLQPCELTDVNGNSQMVAFDVWVWL